MGQSSIPARQWWRLEGDERAESVDRLRAWVEQVYRPSYGHLGEPLPACWPDHPLALFTLAWLSELHSVLYLQPKRSAPVLTGQAEWQTRLRRAAICIPGPCGGWHGASAGGPGCAARR